MTRFALAALIAFAPLTASADVTAFCKVLPGTNAAQCACATEKLRTQVSGTDFALYDAVGTGYLKNRSTGQGWLAAWRASVKTVAAQNGIELTAFKSRLDRIGDIHRAIGDTCK
ncbi:MAG: hypothetical protein VX874_10785 [Pseudomonadota bacterium]|nr:hypothetical protein [Pseudomonadota bacterium]